MPTCAAARNASASGVGAATSTDCRVRTSGIPRGLRDPLGFSEEITSMPLDDLELAMGENPRVY
jgi:hypothetical protein